MMEKQMSGWTSNPSDKWSDWDLPESLLESNLWLIIPTDPVPASTFSAPYMLHLCSWIAYVFFPACQNSFQSFLILSQFFYLTKSVSLSIRLSHCISELKLLLHSLSPVRLGEPEQWAGKWQVVGELLPCSFWIKIWMCPEVMSAYDCCLQGDIHAAAVAVQYLVLI